MKVRNTVRQFAEEMEKGLADHDGDRGERGWIDEGPTALFYSLEDEVEELREALNAVDWGEPANSYDQDAVRKECADIANFAMMIVDVVNDWDSEPPKES